MGTAHFSNTITKTFQDLSCAELYHIMELRSRVFVVEQQCVYQDMDDIDKNSTHAWIQHQDLIVTYLRISPPTDQQSAVSLGRIVTHPDYRGQGLATTLINSCIQSIKKQFNSAIYMSVQSHLTSYYEQFGFTITSDSHLIDQIPHTDMLKTHH